MATPKISEWCCAACGAVACWSEGPVRSHSHPPAAHATCDSARWRSNCFAYYLLCAQTGCCAPPSAFRRSPHLVDTRTHQRKHTLRLIRVIWVQRQRGSSYMQTADLASRIICGAMMSSRLTACTQAASARCAPCPVPRPILLASTKHMHRSVTCSSSAPAPQQWQRAQSRRLQQGIVASSPDTEEARSPLDAPQVCACGWLCGCCGAAAWIVHAYAAPACMPPHACPYASPRFNSSVVPCVHVRAAAPRAAAPPFWFAASLTRACTPHALAAAAAAATAPQEWEAPVPSRRPDIFPEFEKMERVFLPKPLPGAWPPRVPGRVKGWKQGCCLHG